MKPLVLFTCMFWLAACSSTQQIADDLTLPELISRPQFPSFSKPVARPSLKIDLEIQVREDGTVRHARLLNSSGDEAWDSLALAMIQKWEYSPARYQGKPIRLWLHQTAVVEFTEPQLVTLAEIVCATPNDADSVYELLLRGYNFFQAAKQFSVGESRNRNGMLGEVNIHLYPDNLENEIKQLANNEYTKPMKYGDTYVIFMRVKSETQGLLP